MKNRRSPSDERSIPPNIHCCLSNLPKTFVDFNYFARPPNFLFDAEVSAESGPINNGLLREIKVLLDEDERLITEYIFTGVINFRSFGYDTTPSSKICRSIVFLALKVPFFTCSLLCSASFYGCSRTSAFGS
ncbi:hypothetical protein RF11_11986 [Thelohanellus kitauei]|uniref:Uncharacterized protein n=1 Tax=Thelohanellus kitauei TaxID=669202 RepID=A0A0C2IL72_THEKT|nr:hypothetical protein RF11_11986 [Thelohanellus kitauei]